MRHKIIILGEISDDHFDLFMYPISEFMRPMADWYDISTMLWVKDVVKKHRPKAIPRKETGKSLTLYIIE
ncbi:MAG: hypothetical protein LBV26_02730 [Bacteroidales bacterium]|jgi:hypothetical protein|nr:hypothetical protein [Bacteroidales bacterium]